MYIKIVFIKIIYNFTHELYWLYFLKEGVLGECAEDWVVVVVVVVV